eukprot:gnl/TRDRNA2_/TRDRNA2_134182_c0_seq2.p1 gnl/TRDRNA2_/TRDRNA2_134182_c0~~gnl/TRDRNA2_/TRDRNA2_134182_c0_seq2.p1  ORF type:complete len:345 (-),score=64.53 gnl/TRDRNA2_/TRDRNA2_134182_c0_seq2:62-1096(-)
MSLPPTCFCMVRAAGSVFVCALACRGCKSLDAPPGCRAVWRARYVQIEELQLTVNGLGGRTCTVTAQRSWTVRDVKAAIEAAVQIRACQQRLLRDWTELTDDSSEAFATLSPESNEADLTLVVRPAEQAEWLSRAEREWLGLLGGPEAAWADREVVLKAVMQCGPALEHASADLQEDREVVLAAVQQNGLALQHAAHELRADREIALMAVEHCGRALVFVAEELRVDRSFVLQAVQCNWQALMHANAELRDDREVVLAAVSQSGRALACAGPELKSDYEVVEAAVEQDGGALPFASGALRADPSLQELAGRGTGRRLISKRRSRTHSLVFSRQATPEMRADGPS